VILGRHFDVVAEELSECGVVVEQGSALGVGVKNIEGGPGSRAWSKLRVDAFKELLEHRRLKRMEEEDDSGGDGKLELERILLHNFDVCDGVGGGIGRVGASPAVNVGAGDADKLWVELDAKDFSETVLAGDEHATAFAGSDIDEGVAGDGLGRDGLAPAIDERAQDAGGNAVIGGDVLVVGMSREQVARGDKTAGIDPVNLVKRVNGQRGGLEQVTRTRLAGGSREELRSCGDGLRGPSGFGRGHRNADSMLTQRSDARANWGRGGRGSRWARRAD